MKPLALAALMLVLFLVACAPAATPTPLPTATPKPSDTPPPPTATPSPTATPQPTAAPRPTETFTPAATATRTVTPVPTATNTPATETSVIFTDDFSTTNCNLSTLDDTTRKYSCENGEYTMGFKNPNWSGWVMYSGQYDDSVVEVDARPISGDQVTYGIAFRRASNGDFYDFVLSPRGRYSLQFYSGQKWTALIPWTDSLAVSTGTGKNHLKVVAQGNLIALYANDQFLRSIEDSALSKGTVGVYSNTSNPTDRVAFDNFTVSKINRPLTLPAPEATATPTPTIPPGMGGLIVVNFMGDEMNYTIGGKLYKIPGNSQQIIYLPPGKYTFSLDTATGIKPLCNTAQGCTVEIQEGKYYTQPWRLQP